MDKVKVSQEVAEAYKDLEVSWNLTEIFNAVTADFDVCNKNIKILKSWNEDGRDDEGAGLMNLLLGNYEVEQSPEEKIQQYVLEHEKIYNEYQAIDVKISAKATIAGVKYTLDTLGITIEGVNA